MPINLDFPEFVAELTRAIRAREPYCFTRYGDGEGLILGFPQYTKIPNMNGRLDKWFGADTMTIAQKQRFSEDMRQSMREADMVGLPGKRHMEVNFNWRSVGKYVKDFDLLREDTKVCCMDCVLDLQAKGMYDQLFKNSGVRELYCISCRDVERRLKETCNLDKVESFFLPPQNRPCVGPNLSPAPHYPQRYNAVAGWIQEQEPRGKIFLVGAGGLGKVYCMWIKRAGGVALDIGSVFDGWAGAITRSHISAKPGVWRL